MYQENSLIGLIQWGEQNWYNPRREGNRITASATLRRGKVRETASIGLKDICGLPDKGRARQDSRDVPAGHAETAAVVTCVPVELDIALEAGG